MHALNPSPREEHKTGGDGSPFHSDIPGGKNPFRTEVEVKKKASGRQFCFSDLQVNPNICLQIFINCSVAQFFLFKEL